MAHTAVNVASGGRAYDVIGNRKETHTDVTWSGATASETVTAAELGLNAVELARGDVQTSVAGSTGTNVSCAVAATNNQVVVSLNTAAGAGVGAAGSVVRVRARGW